MDLNQYPYYDDHQSQYEKGYKQLLYNPGRPLQARELTQNQSLLIDQLQENFNTLYKNGTLIEGCDLSISSTEDTAYLSSGLLYFDGRVYVVEDQTISITKSGIENIGLKIVETIIDSDDDSTLFDPAAGYNNYNLPGADRLKQIWTIAKDDEDMITFYTITDGVITDAAKKPDYSIIMDTLAKRTYDESGNYLVEGMELYTEASINANKMNFAIDAGKAYVQGYEVNFIVPQKIEVDLSQTFDERLNEPKTFSSGTTNYKLNVPYVKEVEHLSAHVAVASVEIIRGAVSNTADSIPGYSSIYSITKISDTDGGGADYTPSTDYILTGDTVDWSPGGSEPSGGSSYWVDFIYVKDLVLNTDYTLVSNSEDSKYSDVHISGGDTPVDASEMLIDYNYYLARTDLVSINKDGKIIVTTGNPVFYTEDQIPSASEQNLPIGTIKLMPNRDYDESLIYEYKYSRVTMRDLYNLLVRVDDLELNQAELALENQAKSSELPTSLRGILVDNFSDFDKSNITAGDWKCALNLIDNELTAAIDYDNISFDYLNNTETDVDIKNDGGHIDITLERTAETVALEIENKTGTLNLNPYGFIPAAGTVVIDPAVDNWVHEEVKNIVKTKNVNVRSYRTIHRPWLWWWSSRRYVHFRKTKKYLDTSIKNTEKIEEKIAQIAQESIITFTGQDWTVGNRIQINFDDTRIIPATGTVDGDDYLIVQSGGGFTGTFVVPSNTKTGTHKVDFIDIDANLISSATFTSNGVNKIIKKRKVVTKRHEIIRGWRWSRRTRWWNWNGHHRHWFIDPLAQSFNFEDNKMFSSIDLYFKTKGSSDTKAFLQIGYIENGFPSSSSIFHYQEILPEDITVSTDGSVATNIEFTAPIFIPAGKTFFISVGSESNEYSLFISEMGKKDIITDEIVSKNSYLTGILFASSNNDTWTPLQTKDLSFKLYEPTFKTSGNIITENKTGLNIAYINPQIDNILPPETDLKYFYSNDNGVTWESILHDEFNTLDTLNTSAKIKIEFTGNGKLTPSIDFNTLNVITSAFNTDGDNYYQTKQVDNVPAYNTVKTSFDMNLPSGTAATFYGSLDGLLFFPLNRIGDQDETSEIETDVYNYIYTTDITDFSTIGITGTTGTPEEGETFTNGGNSFTYLDHTSSNCLFSDKSGTLTSLTFTGDSSGATITTGGTGDTAYSTGTQFTGKIHLNNTSALSSPVIEKLRFIMKTV